LNTSALVGKKAEIDVVPIIPQEEWEESDIGSSLSLNFHGDVKVNVTSNLVVAGFLDGSGKCTSIVIVPFEDSGNIVFFCGRIADSLNGINDFETVAFDVSQLVWSSHSSFSRCCCYNGSHFHIRSLRAFEVESNQRINELHDAQVAEAATFGCIKGRAAPPNGQACPR
jgi:hypothetical protein